MKAKRKKKWQLCNECHQLVFSSVGTLGNHQCPTKVRAKNDAFIDMEVDEVMEDFDDSLDHFWKSNDVKFYQYLVQNKKV